MDDEYTRVAMLENEVEAELLEGILKDEGIPFLIRSYRDSAYNVLFQLSEGWGYVASYQDYKDRILQILSGIRNDGRE